VGRRVWWPPAAAALYLGPFHIVTALGGQWHRKGGTPMAALTRSTGSSTLWRVYEKKVTRQFNKERILKKRLKLTPKATGEGERIEFPLHIGSSGGITVTGGTTLPNAQYQEHTSGYCNYYHLYGQIKVTGPMLSSTVKGKTAFIDSLDSETNGMISDLKDMDQILLWGNADGLLATVASAAASSANTIITVDNTRNLRRGMVVDVLVKSTGVVGNGGMQVRITDVDHSTPSCTVVTTGLDGGAPTSLTTTDGLYIQGAYGNATTGPSCPWGVQAIISASNPTVANYGGITRTGNAYWQAQSSANGGTKRAVQLSLIDRLIQNISARSSGKPNLIVTTPAIEGIIGGMLVDSKRWRGDATTLDGWYKAVTFAGIPIVPDKHCTPNSLYVFDTDFWYRYFPPDIGEGKWFDHDGHVLARVPGEDSVEATWKSYHQNICTNPSAQGVLADLSES
jgi:hypothetical protein